MMKSTFLEIKHMKGEMIINYMRLLNRLGELTLLQKDPFKQLRF